MRFVLSLRDSSVSLIKLSMGESLESSDASVWLSQTSMTSGISSRSSANVELLKFFGTKSFFKYFLK